MKVENVKKHNLLHVPHMMKHVKIHKLRHKR
jgi:hypothetical protein